MERQQNPFTPLFGQVPYVMAGRREIIGDLVAAFEIGAGSPDLSSLLIGPRGSGKTALLTYLAQEAEQRGWVSVHVTALPSMLENILEQAYASAFHLIDDFGEKKRLTGINLFEGTGVTWERDDAMAVVAMGAERTWRTRMTQLLELLNEKGIGLLITVDEVDPRLPEMAELVATYQHFIREGRKVSLLMAGLPSHVSALLAGKSTSFLRRANQYHLSAIDPSDIQEALQITFGDGGKEIEPEALAIAVQATDGFPYMMQLVGYRSWNASGRDSVVDLEDVRCGIERARIDLNQRIYEATYNDLSKGDIRFLEAMLDDQDASSLSDIRMRLGYKNASSISNFKRRLLNQGVIAEEGKGFVRFILPGFREYLESIRQG